MTVNLRKLLELMLHKRASAMLLTVGAPPALRLQGDLRPLNLPPLTPEDTLHYLKVIAPERSREELQEKGTCTFDIAFDKRANVSVTAVKKGNHCNLEARLVLTPAPGTPILRDLDRRISRRLDMPLRPYCSDLGLAETAIQFAASFGFVCKLKESRDHSALFATYRDRTYERPVRDPAEKAAELCQFLLDILDGNATAT
ncbi:MAG TPA: hypothetical protein VKW04_22445 [Planctomycetota bacterium]|nr:hypothetical protein [Planctomycetota bacterium]